ncbi:MAG: hypothetical protein MUE42_07870 [Opitutaceae bacterium]|jgi:hypothetical protein|nr:hypothetical protein [Opitutaceae bacterium]
MAKKSSVPSLTFRDLVLGADADTLRQALEARVRIDELIAERQAAYERIAALETQVEEVIGEPGVFPFPAPPLPVAGIDAKADSLTRAAGAAPAKKARAAQPDPELDSAPDEDEPETDEAASEPNA